MVFFFLYHYFDLFFPHYPAISIRFHFLTKAVRNRSFPGIEAYPGPICPLIKPCDTRHLTLYHTVPTFNDFLYKKHFENIVGKGENAGNQHFLLFSQCFLSVHCKTISPFLSRDYHL